MKKCLKKAFLLPVILFATVTFLNGQSDKKCCEDAGCAALAKDYAIRVTGLVAYLPPCTSDNEANKRMLDSLKNANPNVHDQLIRAGKEAHTLFFSEAKFRRDGCFSDALPTNFKSNVLKWVAFIGTGGKAPPFPSAEFCSGLKVRFEIGQGATDIGKNTTGYLGSGRVYLSFIPGKKDKCGNNIRLMAGPALFFRGSTLYGALSSRVAFRISDIAPKQFALGNLNLFGEYNTSFGNLSYGAIGGEVELGFIGFNISVNNNMKTGKKGFGVNVFYRF